MQLTNKKLTSDLRQYNITRQHSLASDPCGHIPSYEHRLQLTLSVGKTPVPLPPLAGLSQLKGRKS